MKLKTLKNTSCSWLARGGQTVTILLAACASLIGTLPGYSQPSVSASTPAMPQGHVISLWNSSGAYTNVPVENYFEVWYAADPYFYAMPDTGSNVLLYADMSCCAAITTGTNTPIDVAGCTNLHVDVFTPSGNNLTVRLVDNLGHSADANFLVAGGVITNSGWISLDIPLSTFTSTVNLHYVKQVGWIDNNPDAIVPASYYIDNVYFNAGTNLVYTPPPAIPAPTNNAPTPTNSPVLSMFNSSGSYTDHAGINWHASWSGSAESDFVITNAPGSTVKYMPGLSFVGVEFYDPNQIDTTGFNTLHFDVWTLDANQIGVQLVSLSPTTPATVYSSIGVTQQWVGIDIPLSQFTNDNPAVVLSHLQQLLWLDNGGSGIQSGTFYIDNVYFYSNNIVAPPVVTHPTNNAPTPTKPSGDVLSMYNSSGIYTDHSGINWYANWSGVSSMGDYAIPAPGTATVKSYLGLNYAGVEFYSPNQINATSYNTLHVDVWTTANQLAIKLVSTINGAAPELIYPASSGVITSNHWVSLDIPLSAFTNLAPTLDLANLDQLLWVDNVDIPGSGVQLGKFYFDNIYFYAVATAPTILAPAINGGNIVMQVNSVNGTAYVLEATPSLAPATWTAIQTNAGTGGILNFTNPVAGGNEFFRIKTQ
jgi:hypothetical protein